MGPAIPSLFITEGKKRTKTGTEVTGAERHLLIPKFLMQ